MRTLGFKRDWGLEACATNPLTDTGKVVDRDATLAGVTVSASRPRPAPCLRATLPDRAPTVRGLKRFLFRVRQAVPAAREESSFTPTFVVEFVNLLIR